MVLNRGLISFLAPFLLPLQCWLSAALTIDPSCDDFHGLFESVDTAAAEALDMADYAARRAASTQFPRPGTTMQDLLGATSEDDADLLNTVAGKLDGPFPSAPGFGFGF